MTPSETTPSEATPSETTLGDLGLGDLGLGDLGLGDLGFGEMVSSEATLTDITLSERLLQEFERAQESLDPGAVLYVTALFVVGYLIRRTLLAATRVVWRLGWDRARRLARARSIVDVTLMVVITLLILKQTTSVAPLLTGLIVGLTAILIAIALPTWVQDFVAGVALATRARFREGDLVKLPSAVGSVRHIGVWRTAIRAGDGGTLSVPNREMLANTIQVGREQRAAPIEVVLPPEASATPEAREDLLRLARLSAFRRGGSRPTLTETERGWVIALQTWSTRDIDGARRALERQLLGSNEPEAS
ncbi:MAG: mechanosensitive ion channel domain-containing protein [Myxococcota bacterium]